MITYFSASVKDTSYFASLSLPAHAATRQHRQSIDANVYTKKKPVYVMDVGGWAGGPGGNPQTSFGVISGRDIFLCSWMNKCEGGLTFFEVKKRLPPTMFYNGLGRGAKAFFETEPNLGIRAILAWARLPFKLGLFVPDDVVVIVIPDLHLHLQAGGPLDRFRYGFPGKLISLDEQLRWLLQLKDPLNQIGVRMITVQVGDMYEIWEAECILRYLLKELKKYIDSSEPWVRRHGGDIREDMTYMLRDHLVPKRLINGNSMSWQLWGHTQLSTLTPDEMHNDKCVDASSTQNITKEIRRAHPNLFCGSDSIFDIEVRGNHDNLYSNEFWSQPEHAPDDYYEFPELRFPTKGVNPSYQTRIARMGNGNCIWIEHGHWWDIDNNDEDWWKKKDGMGNGFKVVLSMVRGVVDEWLKTGSSADMTDLARKAADFYTDIRSKEMRLFIALRADAVFKDKSVQLFITGHTHAPCLLEVAEDSSIFWMHPDARIYYNGEDIMPEAKSFADRLRKRKVPIRAEDGQ